MRMSILTFKRKRESWLPLSRVMIFINLIFSGLPSLSMILLKKCFAAVEKRMELKAVMRNKINQTRKIWIAAISLLLLAQITVRCQENTYVSGEVLTLDQAIALALRENHLVKNAELGAGKAEDEMAATRTFRFPSIHLYALAFLREEIEMLPVASSDGSGRIVGR